MKKKFFLFIPVAIIALPSYSWAYIDPGSASALLQLLIAGIVAILSYITIARKKVLNFFKRMFKKK